MRAENLWVDRWCNCKMSSSADASCSVDWLIVYVCISVFKRAHVSQRDAEMFDGDRRRERQPVRGAVCQPVYPHHVPAQTGTHTHTHTQSFWVVLKLIALCLITHKHTNMCPLCYYTQTHTLFEPPLLHYFLSLTHTHTHTDSHTHTHTHTHSSNSLEAAGCCQPVVAHTQTLSVGVSSFLFVHCYYK